MPIAACFIGRVALALDADLAQEAVSKLQQYIQLRTSSRSAAPEALTSDELDAAARMYALEVCNMLSSLNLHVYRQQNKSAGHCLHKAIPGVCMACWLHLEAPCIPNTMRPAVGGGSACRAALQEQQLGQAMQAGH